MSDMSYRFSPDDLRLRTAIGIREPTVIRIPRANGTALYGPYLDLLAGRYEAVIRFDPDLACRGRAIMDVCAGVGTERLAWQGISADQILADDMSARLVFSCVRAAQGVEVRLLVNGEFSAGIVSVEISGELAKSVSAESLSAEPASELLSVTISDLPETSVENSVRKGRNLYEGYQRGIGLGGWVPPHCAPNEYGAGWAGPYGGQAGPFYGEWGNGGFGGGQGPCNGLGNYSNSWSNPPR